MAGPKNIETLNYGRKLDDESRADFDVILSGDDCCGELGKLMPFAHSFEIKRNDIQVWYGWIEDIEEERAYFLDAFDAIGWLKRRRIHSDMSWVTTDVTDIFVDVWNDAMAPDPIQAALVTIPTGVLESRSVKLSENRMAWNVVKEMLDSGLDITTFGQKVLGGIIHSRKPIELKLSDFQGPVRLAKLGSRYANSITVDASEQIQATYPDRAPQPTDHFPLVEAVVKDTMLQDYQSAYNKAQSIYNYNRNIPIIVSNTDNLELNPNVDIDINDLIPGVKVILDTEGMCTHIRQEFILSEMKVKVSSGSEKISISLQPAADLSLALESTV